MHFDRYYMYICVCVMGVMKMGNTVPRVGLEPTSLAFWASVLSLHHVSFPDVTRISTPMSIQLLSSEVSADYYIYDMAIYDMAIL